MECLLFREFYSVNEGVVLASVQVTLSGAANTCSWLVERHYRSFNKHLVDQVLHLPGTAEMYVLLRLKHLLASLQSAQVCAAGVMEILMIRTL